MEPGLQLSCQDHSPTTESECDLILCVPYRSLVGSLMYLVVGTHPDISIAVQQLCKFLDSYGKVHWDAAKQVVHYLKGTHDFRLILGGDHTAQLIAYTDSDLGSCIDTHRSVSRYCSSLGSGLVTWSACQQKTVAPSTCEAKYIAASEAGKEIAWLHMLLHEIELLQFSASLLMCDNNGAIVLTEDPSFHAHVKHIDIARHSIRECVSLHQLKLHYVRSKENLADIFTKALPKKDFHRLHACLGLR